MKDTTGPQMISIPGGLTDLKAATEGSELDALFNASRQVEATLNRERSLASRLKNDLTALQSRYARESAQAQQTLKQYAARDESLRAQLASYHLQLQASHAHLKQLQEKLERAQSDGLENARKQQLSQSVIQANLERTQKQAQYLERALELQSPQLAAAQADLERERSDSRDREQKFQAAISAHQNHHKTLIENISSLKQALKRAHEELDQHRAQASQTARIQQQAEQSLQRQEGLQRQFQTQLQQMTETNRTLTERLAIEKRRREQSDAMAKAGIDEKEMLLSCLKTTEERLAETEKRRSEMSAELALLRSAHAAQLAAQRLAAEKRASILPEPRYVPLPDDGFEFEGLEKLALMGYPTVRP